jgi:hypothetical protein
VRDPGSDISVTFNFEPDVDQFTLFEIRQRAILLLDGPK